MKAIDVVKAGKTLISKAQTDEEIYFLSCAVCALAALDDLPERFGQALVKAIEKINGEGK